MSWIKLHRCLQQHWLWSDAERLKWWLDLLFMAKWKQCQIMHDSHLITLRPGQMVASVAFLCQKWQRNHQTVIRYLNTLEREGMIERNVMYRQTAIITICQYETYQVEEDTALSTITDTLTDDLTDSQIDGQIDGIAYTNRRIKEYISSSSSEKINKKDGPKDFRSLLCGDEKWQASIARKHKIEPHEVREQLDAFWLDTECRGVEHRNLTDAKKHFTDWLTIQQEQGRRKRKPAPNRQQLTVAAAIPEEPEQPQKSKEELYRERMLGMIELANKNPSSSCMKTLREAYRSGQLQSVGIDWVPPGESDTAANLIASNPNGRLAKIFNK